MTPQTLILIIVGCIVVVSSAFSRYNLRGWSNEWLMAIVGVAAGIGLSALAVLATSVGN